MTAVGSRDIPEGSCRGTCLQEPPGLVEGKLLIIETTVIRKKGLGAVILQIKRAQPKPKARGWDMIKEMALDMGT